MFPHCSVSLSGLKLFANYVIMVDMVPVDGYKYKVRGRRNIVYVLFMYFALLFQKTRH